MTKIGAHEVLKEEKLGRIVRNNNCELVFRVHSKNFVLFINSTYLVLLYLRNRDGFSFVLIRFLLFSDMVGQNQWGFDSGKDDSCETCSCKVLEIAESLCSEYSISKRNCETEMQYSYIMNIMHCDDSFWMIPFKIMTEHIVWARRRL